MRSDPRRRFADDQLLRNLLITDTLPSWWTNRIKRLARRPKRYIVDPSLALTVLRIAVPGLMKDGDLLGRIIDTFVVAQLRAQLACCETQPRLFHLRQAKGQHEIDMIVEYGGGRVLGFAIKATSAPPAMTPATWPGCATHWPTALSAAPCCTPAHAPSPWATTSPPHPSPHSGVTNPKGSRSQAGRPAAPAGR